MAINLDLEIMKAFEDNARKNVKNVNNILEEEAKKVVEELKVKSPRGKSKKPFSKGWTLTNEGLSIVIHNKNKPTLVHLIENGYRLKNGKIKAGQYIMTRAYEKGKNNIIKKLKN